MINCMNLGVLLSSPENGWVYAEERAKEIVSETIRQANFITANSKNITDILSARQVLVFLYCNREKFDLASNEARNFPPRADLTMYSAMAPSVNAWRSTKNRRHICAAISTIRCRRLKMIRHGSKRHVAATVNVGCRYRIRNIFRSNACNI